MSDERQPVAVFVTAPDKESALLVARKTVEEGVAACGQLLPDMTSVYRWQGIVHEDPEYLVILKSQRDAVARLMDVVVEVHPYEVPQITVVPLCDVYPPYRVWLDQNVTRG